ncbi:MAG: thymidine kinase [candidate division WOR-3 bacterium]
MVDKYKNGKLIVITGPMFSGKTSELLRQIRRLELSDKKCILIKYVNDKRYGKERECCTHDLVSRNAIPTKQLSEVITRCYEYDVIGIDEGQFFPDLVDFIMLMVEQLDKIVIVAGLDGTYQGKTFGRIAELLPLSDHFVKLTAVCRRCGQDAPFTIRRPDFNTQSNSIEIIGADDIYEAVCRKCRAKIAPITTFSS